ncbi:uncharacterized protein BJ171DRAFT_598514 [Polychytrium aggregatum]|uniref:uncharacterized protein n=1 Tax=Polychytrium aggregatum TaxID=110093 RepID=UPI0022FE5A85|nr:uncharacterized protein BJ171DRAFT_598514 [Polychytrium aggregatum]KAI9205407.1 hypothetical protein BJ171DRAFT_598514 [Polychytrium aggregatum]
MAAENPQLLRLLGTLVWLLSLTGLAMASSPPTGVAISSITYGGSGCPQGTVGTSIASDSTSFTLIYDQFVASAGPSSTITDSRKFCQISLGIHVPPGWQFSILTVDYRGFVQLPASGTASESGFYYFQGRGNQAPFSVDFTGPISKNYLKRAYDAVPTQNLNWSDCGQSTVVNIQNSVLIHVDPASGDSGLITTDSTDGKVTQVFGLNWNQC